MNSWAIRSRRPGMKHRRGALTHFELLEERLLLSIFTVTNNADSGPGSLRQAIVNADTNKGLDTIDFNIKVGAISEVAIPTSSSGPEGITTGPDGNLWFTQAATNQIGRLTPLGIITEFPIPTPSSAPAGITAGPDGNLWFTESGSNQIGRITPAGAITEYPIGTRAGIPEGITAGPDGNLWFTESGFLSDIGRITPGGAITLYPLARDSGPLGITTGADGNLWFTDEVANEVGRITTAGTITQFTVPTPNSQPEDITAGAGGNLWFTEFNANQIGSINPTTGAIAEFPIPTTGSTPIGITSAADGNLWFAESSGNQIGRIDPITHAITEFPVPTASSSPFGITTGPDNNLWFTENVGNRIGRVTLASSGLTITPTSALPIISDPAIVDGTSQPGFAGSPIIELDGASAGTGVNGLTIARAGGGSTVLGLVINRFNGNGIALDVGGNVIVGNFIGTDVTGTVALANGISGLDVFSSNNTIGGVSPATRNLISGNGLDGIDLTNAAATGNLVQGNFIGTDVTGESKLGNARHGVAITSVTNSGSPSGLNNTIGGLGAGAGNLISGNGSFGVVIFGPYGGATGNLVQGNLIGTDASGEHNLGNTGDGVVISSAAGNTVGGSDIAARNVISGNGRYGVVIESTTSTGNLLENNFIGTDKTGESAIGNVLDGVIIQLGASDNTVGGAAAGAGNLISGNLGNGIDITNAGTSSNLVVGNRIGTDAKGTVALGNGISGLDVFSSNNTIGGMSPATRNLISGNGLDGIDLTNAAATGNVVQGNFIGTDVTGESKLGNARHGVAISSVTDSGSPSGSNNTIGGLGAGAGNLISGNGSFGVVIFGPYGGATGNLVQGNLIGTDASGEHNLGNTGDGVVISSAAGNTVGGSDIAARNVISGNGRYGVVIESTTSTGNLLENNFIGTDKTGESAIGNVLDGVIIQLGASDNTVGGAAAGAGNLISGNLGNGVDITNAGTSGNLVVGDRIGTDANGEKRLGNTLDGILLNGVSSNSITGNVVSGNGVGQDAAGVDLLANATANAVAGNLIGTGADGTTALGNSLDGIEVGNGSSDNILGPSNVISSNGAGTGRGIGVYIFSSNTSGNILQGNDIGTNSNGTTAITGSVIGVLINAAPGNTVQGNVISGNQVIGVDISEGTATKNVVQANKIGTNKAGTAAIPNGADGIFINEAPGNTVGGTTTDAGNLVSGNGQIGIQIFGLGASGNVIENNILGRTSTGARGAGLLNGNSADLGIYVNTTPNINTITANTGQGQRESPTGAPFAPGDPTSAKGASPAVRHSRGHSRPFAHRPFLKPRNRPGQRPHMAGTAHPRAIKTGLSVTTAGMEESRAAVDNGTTFLSQVNHR